MRTRSGRGHVYVDIGTRAPRPPERNGSKGLSHTTRIRLWRTATPASWSCLRSHRPEVVEDVDRRVSSRWFRRCGSLACAARRHRRRAVQRRAPNPRTSTAPPPRRASIRSSPRRWADMTGVRDDVRRLDDRSGLPATTSMRSATPARSARSNVCDSHVGDRRRGECHGSGRSPRALPVRDDRSDDVRTGAGLRSRTTTAAEVEPTRLDRTPHEPQRAGPGESSGSMTTMVVRYARQERSVRSIAPQTTSMMWS